MTGVFELDALILAGGMSRRMGRNKSLLPYQGQPLIQHIANQLLPCAREIRISTNAPDAFSFLGLPMIPDRLPDQGPLMGIASGLQASSRAWTLVVPTDMPELPLHLLPAMQACAALSRCVAPQTPDGRVQPLFGLYHRSLAGEILAFLASGERRVMTFFTRCGAAIVPAEAGIIANLNEPESYRSALK